MPVKKAAKTIAGAAVVATAAAAFTVAPADAAPTWAAIVYSPATGAQGWSYDAAAKQHAIDIAMGYCIQYGGTDCQMAASADRGCLALADSPSHWAGGLGPTLAAAEQDALAQNGGGVILVSGCA